MLSEDFLDRDRSLSGPCLQGSGSPAVRVCGLGAYGEIALPTLGRALISAQLIEAAGAVAEALRRCAHPVEHRQK